MQSLVLKASFETVSTVDLGQVLCELNRVATPLIWAGKRSCTQRSQSADVDRRQAPVSVGLWDALDAVLGGNAADQRGGRLVKVTKPAISESGLINQCR